MERAFCEYCHYRKDSGTAGLDASQVRLLHSDWSRFASSGSLLASALHLPQHLSEAGASIGVRHDLAGAALGVVSDALMRMIEEEHGRRILLLRLIERLNLQLAAADQGPSPDPNPVASFELVPTPEQLDPETSLLVMEVLALANEQAQQMQRALRRLAGTRALLVQATQYGHLLGRFLIKRHRRVARVKRAARHRPGPAKGKEEAPVPVPVPVRL